MLVLVAVAVAVLVLVVAVGVELVVRCSIASVTNEQIREKLPFGVTGRL